VSGVPGADPPPSRGGEQPHVRDRHCGGARAPRSWPFSRSPGGVADTLAETSASTSVLERCGFEKVDELIDADEGAVWRWEASLVDT
jgi:hypothetical protein